MTIKERLHQAVDTMSDEEARAALRTLAEASGDPVAWTLDHAPLDDEVETEEERGAVAEARADRERGIQPVPARGRPRRVRRRVTDAYWRVVVDDRARKDLRRIDPQARERILRAITRLAAGAELAGETSSG